MTLDKADLEKYVASCLAPFDIAERWLLEAENILFEQRDKPPGQKSEVRQRFEKFEENVNKAWRIECEKYGVKEGYVLDLPKDVYRGVCEEYIEKQGQQLFLWLQDQIVKWKDGYTEEPARNPYILAICALQKSYNIFGDSNE